MYRAEPEVNRSEVFRGRGHVWFCNYRDGWRSTKQTRSGVVPQKAYNTWNPWITLSLPLSLSLFLSLSLSLCLCLSVYLSILLFVCKRGDWGVWFCSCGGTNKQLEFKQANSSSTGLLRTVGQEFFHTCYLCTQMLATSVLTAYTCAC